MLLRHVPLTDQIGKFFHGTLVTLVYLPASCAYKETFLRRVSFTTTFLARQSLPKPSIIVPDRSTMGTRLRSSTTIAIVPVTSVLLPDATVFIRGSLIGCSRYTNTTTIRIFVGSNRLQFRSAALDLLTDYSYCTRCLGYHWMRRCDRSLVEFV